MTNRFKLLFLSLLLALSFLTPALSFAAENLAVRAVNLESVSEADSYAKAWIENYRKESPNLDEPVLLLHVGNEVPEQLKWIVVHLERAHIPYELKLIQKDELDRELSNANSKATELLSFKNLGTANTYSLWKKSKL